MLAKIWKKLLLAICIIAILFNITAKLVNRISLEKAISSTPEGVNMREILNITEEQTTTPTEPSVSKYKTVEEVESEKRAEQEAESQEYVEPEGQEYVEPETEEGNPEGTEEKKTGGKIIDMVTQSITDTKKYDNLLN